MRFSTGGSTDDKTDLLESIDGVIGDLNYYDVVTPEKVYINANLTHQDYRRSAANGVGLLQVDVWMQEVRVASDSGSAFGSTQSAASAGQTNGGTVQPTAPTGNQAAQVPSDLAN